MEQWLGLQPVKEYRGLYLDDLPLNHAYVYVNTSVDNVGVYAVSDDCYNCPYNLRKHLTAGKEESWKESIAEHSSWRILRNDKLSYELARNEKEGWLCQMRPVFQEAGVYRLDIGRCEVAQEVTPVNTLLPFLFCNSILLCTIVLYSLLKCIWRRRRNGTRKDDFEINSDSDDNNSANLHFFRNLLMALIIFITTGGGGYPIFNRGWGGLTLSECLFSAFAWTIGVNIPTVTDRARNSKNKCSTTKDIFKRGLVLIFLGIAIDSTVRRYVSTEAVALWCPLQRLGIAYVAVATTYVLTVKTVEIKSKRILCKAIGNLVSLFWCWTLTAALLVVIIILIVTFGSFNCLGDADFNQGESDILTEMSISSSCNSHTSEYVNKILVGDNTKIVDVNGYIGFSRGIMGILSTIVTTMIGLKSGIVYLHVTSHADRLKLWSLWATTIGIGGTIFAGVSHPLNFNLWPISSIFMITTLTVYMFELSYVLTEAWKFTRSATSGSSASLIILAGHLTFSSSLPFRWGIMFHNHIMYLLQCYWIVILWLIIGRSLFKNVKFDM